MPQAPLVIGIGHVTCDIIIPLECWPAKDIKTIIPELTLAGGGPTANAMAALAKLGVPAAVVGKVGADVFGSYIVAAHQADGIDTSHLQVDPRAMSPVSVILADLSDSTRTILLTKGSGTQLAPGELDFAWLSQARIVHLDGHQMPASLELVRRRKDLPDTALVLDAGSMREGMLDLCQACDVVFASQRFANELAPGCDAAQALLQLSRLGPRVAGITLGINGCIYQVEDRTAEQPALHVAAQDTTGAGDAFHGGLMYGLLKGLPIEACVRIAAAVAALKCRGIGARASLPEAQQLVEFLIAEGFQDAGLSE